MPSISINPIFHLGVVIAIAVVMTALLLLGPAASRIKGRRRVWLIALRLLAIIAIIFSMLRPTLVYKSTEERIATLPIIVDDSRSMGISDDGEVTRWEQLQAALEEALPELMDLGENLKVKFYRFGAEPEEITLSSGTLTFPDEPTESETAIGHAISEVRRQNAGERIIGMVLLTDGNQKAIVPRDRPPLNEARELNASGVALYAVAFGTSSSQEQLRDISIEQLSAPERIFEKNKMLVTAQARLFGFANRAMQVDLLMENGAGEMEVVDSQTIQSRRDGDIIPIELSHIPRLPGERKVQVRVADQQGELVTVNNEQSTFVTVDAGGISVFYMEGKPRHEQRNVRKSLDGSANIELILFPLDAEEFIRAGTVDNPRRPATIAPLLDEAFTPGRHNVYILGDVDSKAFTPEELVRLRECVDVGSGLIMIGGAHAFSGGGYADSPLAAVLPVELNRLGNQQYGQPIRSDLHIAGPIQTVPSALNDRHYVIRLESERDANMQLWRNLPPQDGVNKIQPRNSANILLEGTAPTEPGRIPILVSDVYGGGRTLAFAGDSTHRWVLPGFGDQHKRFWRQLILWLAQKDQGADGAVRIVLDERRLRQNARASFTLQAFTTEEEPIPDAEWTAQIVLPDGEKRQLNLNRRGNDMVGSFAETLAAGDYVIEARAVRNGEELGASRARFLVFEQDLEMDRPVADFDALATWTAASAGGKVYGPKQFSELIEELRKLPQQLSKTSYLKVTLWDRWPLYAIIACLMVAEWFFRKKWGLV